MSSFGLRAYHGQNLTSSGKYDILSIRWVVNPEYTMEYDKVTEYFRVWPAPPAGAPAAHRCRFAAGPLVCGYASTGRGIDGPRGVYKYKDKKIKEGNG